MIPSLADRLAVCSWSLQPESPQHLIESMRCTGIDQLQLALDPIREGGVWRDTKRMLEDAELQVIGGMMRSVGEDYTSLDSIRRTGGVVPDDSWPKTWENMQQMVPVAEDLNLDYVMFHAGFLPRDRTAPSFGKLKKRIEMIADAFAQIGACIGLESGQEDAQTLLQFLEYIERDHVGINFDPANMILYDKGDPVETLKLLVPHVIQCHIKDAVKSQERGAWGREVVVGTGQVNWSDFLCVLQDSEFDGPLAIERESGDSTVEDICAARRHLLSLPRK
jgi:sugar phosphate isomerase/epimerase